MKLAAGLLAAVRIAAAAGIQAVTAGRFVLVRGREGRAVLLA